MIVTLAVFSVFAIYFLKERFAWNYAAAFLRLGRSTETLGERPVKPLALL